MRIDYSGAAGSVTGSSHLLTVMGHKILLDCGLYQGKDAREKGNDRFSFNPSEIEYLILSHAHIDHSGRIPMLVKLGFSGKIICNEPTRDLCEIMLADSAYIQEQDAERENKKLSRQGKPLVEPIYTNADAQKAMTYFEIMNYEEEKEIFPGLKVRLKDSGHMLGSSFVELFIEEVGKKPLKLVFSGDVGNHNIPLCKEPAIIDKADILLLESTYGNREHMPSVNENQKFIDNINKVVARGGNVVIPSFSVGRTQEILFIINEYAEAGKLHPDVKVIVDSPLSSKATEVFKKHVSYMDEETQVFIRRGDNVFEFPGLSFTENVEESKILNETKKGMVIISSSGMADAGRVRHHIKHNIWRPECAIFFVGYQAEGTLGNIIQGGAKNVKIMGETVNVQAEIVTFSGLSGHADSKGLVEWVMKFSEKPQKVYLVHGDEDAREALKLKLEDKGLKVGKPTFGGVTEINSADDIKDTFSKIEIPALHVEDKEEKSDETEGYEVADTLIPKDRHEGRIKNQLKKTIDELNFEALSEDEIIKRLREIIRK